METTFYTVPARRVTMSSVAPAYENAPTRELVCLSRQAPAHAGKTGQIIDFTAWKQDHDLDVDQPQEVLEPKAPRPAGRTSGLCWLIQHGEWVATLSVIGAMLLLSLRILVA